MPIIGLLQPEYTGVVADRPRLGRKEPNMLVIGCDHHPSVQHIAWIYTETGECGERQLWHSDGEAEKFYRDLKAKGVNVRVGIEATGHARWLERLLVELKFELWVGDPAQIKDAADSDLPWRRWRA